MEVLTADAHGSMVAQTFVVEGVTINCKSVLPTASRIASDCDGESSFGVFTLNLDHVVKLRRSADFRAAYRAARYVTADGFPIVWAGRLTGANVNRVAGSDLIEPICAEAAGSGQSIFLFGGSLAALTGAARHLQGRFPGLKIAGICAPEAQFNPTPERVASYARQIADSGAKICFVALGAPKQEVFSALAINQTTGVAFVCIGAGLDFLAGVQARAPQWMQDAGVEWLWRLVCNPQKLARRYLECLLVLPHVLLQSSSGWRRVAKLRWNW